MFFNLFKKEKKFTRENHYYCKHCGFNCNTCVTALCFSCYVHEGNPCPGCGKTNKQAREAKEAKSLNNTK